MSDAVDRALAELQRLNPQEALGVLDKLEENRRKLHFIRYWQPYPKQAEVVKRFTAEKKVFGLLGGNRSGKTELGAFICCAWALGLDYFRDEPAWEYVKDLPIPEPPNTIWVVGLDYSTLRDVIWREKLKTGKEHPPLLPQDPAIVTDVRDGDFQIFFANGSVITGKSADSGREKFQSASVDLIWIDEEPEGAIYDECYQRTIDCAGKILLTLTPLTDVNSGVRTPWVFDLYENWTAGQKDLEFCQLSMLDNPFIPEEEKVKAIHKWAGSPEEQARLYGKFVRRSGLVYPNWDSKKHIIQPFRIPQSWRRFVSIDPAATGVTAAIWGAVENGSNNLYLYKEYYERDLIVSDHVKNILLRNGTDPVDMWLLDPTWGAQREAIQHKTGAQIYREAGIPVRLPDVGDDFGLNTSREYLNATVTPGARHPKMFVFSTLTNFRWEIERYTWDMFSRGELKGLSKDKPRKRNDHLMNAWQYLCAIRPHGIQRASYSKNITAVRNNSYSGDDFGDFGGTVDKGPSQSVEDIYRR